MARVTAISTTPVKALGLSSCVEVMLGPAGVPENRRFHLVDDSGRLVNGKTAGQLVQVEARADGDAGMLELRFPDGTVLAGSVEQEDEIETDFYGRPVAGRIVGGAFAAALSAFAGRPLRLVRLDEPGDGSDRGLDGSISIVSAEALELLAREAGVDAVDARRFRMLFTIAGVAPNEEDAWVGRHVAIGEAVVRLYGRVGRCAVTCQNPESGVTDLDTLRVLRGYRPSAENEEPLPMGVFGGVERPGKVRIGDAVEPV